MPFRSPTESLVETAASELLASCRVEVVRGADVDAALRDDLLPKLLPDQIRVRDAVTQVTEIVQ